MVKVEESSAKPSEIKLDKKCILTSFLFLYIYYFFYNIVLTIVRGNNHNLGSGNLYLQLKEEKVLLNLIAKIYIFVEGRCYERCIE